MSLLVNIYKSIDKMFETCEIDYMELKTKKIDNHFFDDFQNQRIVNSFLFSYTKIQDKIGAKLFRTVLYEQKEIEDFNMPMKDILNLLEKLSLIGEVEIWDKLREIRNNLAHEYPFDLEERVENIEMAMDGYENIKIIYKSLKNYSDITN
jgi:hypothetical protein